MRLNGPSARSQMTEKKKIVDNQVVLGREEDRNGINQEGSKDISQQQPDRLRRKTDQKRDECKAGEEELEGIHWGAFAHNSHHGGEGGRGWQFIISTADNTHTRPHYGGNIVPRTTGRSTPVAGHVMRLCQTWLIGCGFASK